MNHALLSSSPKRSDVFEARTDCGMRTSLAQVMQDAFAEYPETAFCFFNRRQLIDKSEVLQNYFLPEYRHAAVAYAVKANPKLCILNTVLDSGVHDFDCASVTEIQAVKSLDDQAHAFYNHPIKKNKDIATAWESGVRMFTAQSRNEIDKLLPYLGQSNTSEVMMRLATPNPDSAINLSTKFGADPADVAAMAEYLVSLGFGQTMSLSVNTGSQNYNSQAFLDAMVLIRDFCDQYGNPNTINLGGGLPVDYDGSGLDVRQYLSVISAGARTILKNQLRAGVRLIIEPGRAMVAESIDLTIPILAIEQRQGQRCLYIDDGLFTSFSDTAVHGWRYHFQVIDQHAIPRRGGLTECRVFGRTCDSGDVIQQVYLPADTATGDYLWIKKAGAYMDSQTTFFNGFAPPTYVTYASY